MNKPALNLNWVEQLKSGMLNDTHLISFWHRSSASSKLIAKSKFALSDLAYVEGTHFSHVLWLKNIAAKRIILMFEVTDETTTRDFVLRDDADILQIRFNDVETMQDKTVVAEYAYITDPAAMFDTGLDDKAVSFVRQINAAIRSQAKRWESALNASIFKQTTCLYPSEFVGILSPQPPVVIRRSNPQRSIQGVGDK